MNIEEASRACGISKDMIRFYEKKGLIRPGRNPANDYRDYQVRDLRRLVLIRQYNAMGVPLSEIRELLDGKNQDSGLLSVRQAIRKKKEDLWLLEAQLAALEDMESLLQAVSDGSMITQGIRKRMYFVLSDNVNTLEKIYPYESAARAVCIVDGLENGDHGCIYRFGFAFFRKPPTAGDFEVIEQHLFVRAAAMVPADHNVSGERLLSIRQDLIRKGYAPGCSCSVYQVLMPSRERADEVMAAVEFPLEDESI